jgi:hypothetical protein
MDQRDEMLLALEDPTTAIVAHGLLNSMAVLSGTATTMLNHWDKVVEDPERARELLLRIVRQASMASGVLEDLVRGLPPQVTNTLVVLEGGRGAEAPAP